VTQTLSWMAQQQAVSCGRRGQALSGQPGGGDLVGGLHLDAEVVHRGELAVGALDEHEPVRGTGLITAERRGT
jgi:hypothetical protein